MTILVLSFFFEYDNTIVKKSTIRAFLAKMKRRFKYSQIMLRRYLYRRKKERRLLGTRGYRGKPTEFRIPNSEFGIPEFDDGECTPEVHGDSRSGK